MSLTYSALLRLTYQGTADDPSTWGDVMQQGVLALLEDSLSGLTEIATTGGTTTLATANGAADEARRMILRFSGVLVANVTIIVPSLTKVYVVNNNTTGAFSLTVKTLAGSGQAVIQGNTKILWCDGVDVKPAVATGGALVGFQAITASGTYTKTSTANAILVEQVGGGGAGGGGPAAPGDTNHVSAAGGGGAGAYAVKFIAAPSASYAVTVGAAGTGVADGNGNAGGDTIFGTSVVLAKGGSGALRQNVGNTIATFPGALGGLATTSIGDFKVSGGNGRRGYRLSGTQGWSGAGGSSRFGKGGNSMYAIFPNSTTGGFGGNSATAPGAGGSGQLCINTSVTQVGNSGAAGLCLVWEFA